MQENEKNNGMTQQPTPAVPATGHPAQNPAVQAAQPAAPAAPVAAQPAANPAAQAAQPAAPVPGQPAANPAAQAGQPAAPVPGQPAATNAAPQPGQPAQGEQAANPVAQAGQTIQNVMGNINPGNPFKLAAHGASFLAGVVKNDTSAFQIQKATGEELLNQLKQVQNESNEYKSQADSMDKERVQKALNQKMISFKYKVKDSSGKVIVNTFEAPTANDVKVFLKNEGYEVLEVTERSKYDIDINMATKINNGDLSFMLTQLSTYIKAGIPLINSVRILAKQTTNAMHKKVLNKIVYELVVGEKFSLALEKQGKTFPNLLINMVKTSEMTGDLAGTLDEMAAYYTEVDKSRKALVSALVYPAAILTVAIVAVAFIIIYVVPQFVGMFASNNAELPAITKFIIAASDFLGAHWWKIIIGIIVFIIVFMQLYKRIRDFRKTVQTFMMHMPVFGNVIIYNEVSTLTRTFASLLNHSVFITDSMEILSKLSNNEIYKEIINRTLITLSKGGKISDSFKGEWAFPVVAYEMLVTGESTGQLALMMEKVAEHYQNLHTNTVTTMKSLIEPIIICFLAVAVGFIIMSIILPMFDLYGQL